MRREPSIERAVSFIDGQNLCFAASEGLNLQAASALINYDLPWNPSKVEQRIGRIDRIGQKMPDVKVVNLFLKDSVDDKVYRALRRRCRLFEQFVGHMQPVLAKARKMLLGQERPDPSALQAVADQVDQDPMAAEIYMESEAQGSYGLEVPLARAHLEWALASLKGDLGLKVKFDKGMERFAVSGPGLSKTVFSGRREVLERDQKIVPLCPFQPKLRDLAKALDREAERLPLVIGSHQKGGFRASVAYWVGEGQPEPVESLEELRRLIEAWDGAYPDPGLWIRAKSAAQEAAQKHVTSMEQLAAKRERKARQAQVSAARLRLLKELGRYLFCLGAEAGDLNTVLYEQMKRDTSSAQRLKKSLDKLGGYPEWSDSLCQELEAFVKALSESQRKARLMGNEIDAALEDPRWAVAG